MKRSLFRLAVLALGAFVLWGPNEAEAQSIVCGPPTFCCSPWCSGIFFPLGWAGSKQECCEVVTGVCFEVSKLEPIGQCCWGGPSC